MQKRRTPSTISQLIRRLPLQQDIKISSSVVNKIQPVWQKWRDQHLTGGAHLCHFKVGVLTILCESAISATQLRHQQQTLLEHFRQNNLPDITQIKITVSQPTAHNNNDLSQKAVAETVNRKKPSDKALTSLENCGKLTKNTRLAESIRSLQDSIKDLKS